MGIQIYHDATDIENLFLGCEQKFKPKTLEVDLEVLRGEAALEAALEANEKHSASHRSPFFPSTVF